MNSLPKWNISDMILFCCCWNMPGKSQFLKFTSCGQQSFFLIQTLYITNNYEYYNMNIGVLPLWYWCYIFWIIRWFIWHFPFFTGQPPIDHMMRTRGTNRGRLNLVRLKNLMGFENRQATGAGFLKFAGSVSNSITDNWFLQLPVSADYRFLPVLPVWVKLAEILNRRRLEVDHENFHKTILFDCQCKRSTAADEQ